MSLTVPVFCRSQHTSWTMETVVRRCPFLSRVPQAFLQKAGKSLLFYAQNCPKMMEFGAKPAPRALSTSAGHCQQIKETPPASESKCQVVKGQVGVLTAKQLSIHSGDEGCLQVRIPLCPGLCLRHLGSGVTVALAPPSRCFDFSHF